MKPNSLHKTTTQEAKCTKSDIWKTKVGVLNNRRRKRGHKNISLKKKLLSLEDKLTKFKIILLKNAKNLKIKVFQKLYTFSVIK